jgi:transposase
MTNKTYIITNTSGHSEKDSGAVTKKDGKLIKEADLAVKFRNAVLHYLQQDKSIITRTDGYGKTNLSLNEAAKLIDGADLSIEWHLNASSNPTATGVETIALPKDKVLAQKISSVVAQALQRVRVQNTVAELFNTSAYIVRSIMESAVEYGLEQRGEIANLKHVSLDEKAYTQGHKYATILIDSDNDYVVEMTEGRKEKNVKALFFSLNSSETYPNLQRVNVDMWKPYMKAIKDIAPKAIIVHDKFHLFKKLSEAIDKTRRKEVKEHEQLKNQKYTVLKNQENRTEQQKKDFDKMLQDNLLTAKAWQIRENFKYLFQVNQNIELHYQMWKQDAKEKAITAINNVIETFDRHLTGIINAIQTKTSSAKHENLNGKIQAVMAKARGFVNFERFRINTLFYFGKLNLTPQKIY